MLYTWCQHQLTKISSKNKKTEKRNLRKGYREEIKCCSQELKVHKAFTFLIEFSRIEITKAFSLNQPVLQFTATRRRMCSCPGDVIVLIKVAVGVRHFDLSEKFGQWQETKWKIRIHPSHFFSQRPVFQFHSVNPSGRTKVSPSFSAAEFCTVIVPFAGFWKGTEPPGSVPGRWKGVKFACFVCAFSAVFVQVIVFSDWPFRCCQAFDSFWFLRLVFCLLSKDPVGRGV